MSIVSGCLFCQLERRLVIGLGGTEQRKDAAVMAAVGLHIEDEAAGNTVRRVNKSLKHRRVRFLADAEIRNAFNKLCHSTFSFYSYENHRL